jgi:hypothetical protein
MSRVDPSAKSCRGAQLHFCRGLKDHALWWRDGDLHQLRGSRTGIPRTVLKPLENGCMLRRAGGDPLATFVRDCRRRFQ